MPTSQPADDNKLQTMALTVWAGRQIYSHLNVEAVARQECKHVIVSSKNINYETLAQHVPPPALHSTARPLSQLISRKTQTESFKKPLQVYQT